MCRTGTTGFASRDCIGAANSAKLRVQRLVREPGVPYRPSAVPRATGPRQIAMGVKIRDLDSGQQKPNVERTLTPAT